ncbi:MAG: ABC transporter ATP-binding protein [Methylocystis sp.]|nr:ABC transporter ATP-binding protein [Acidobacteriaceae bacterium]MCA3475565.1 ABC transporter ATP-binding protein [Rhodobacter sp.]MCA3583532.1 ABC transporter ATP-binding protein [Methylocystis sp.]
MSSESEVLIDARGLGKCYRLYARPQDRLKQFLLPRRRFFQDMWALRGVDLKVARGQTVGILGRNGSGKSTLLQIICGTLQPTGGELAVRGRISALLELGAGFNPEFTGRENVRLYGAILGLDADEVTERLPRILEFAGIGDYVDRPVKTYSSGMFVRLAFSAAIHVDPDILVVDEALAVGDAEFQARCMARIKAMQECGVSILYVSHDTEGVKRLCSEVLVLHDGRVVNRGRPVDVANWYVAFSTVGYDLARLGDMEAQLAEQQAPAPAPESPSQPVVEPEDGDSPPVFNLFRHGDGTARIFRVQLRDETDAVVTRVVLGRFMSVAFDVRFERAVPAYVVGFYVTDRLGTHVIGLNTYQERVALPPAQAGEQRRFEFRIPVEVRPGHYSLTVSIAYNQYDHRWLDHIDNALVFRVVDNDPKRLVFGVYLPATRDFATRLLDAEAPAEDPEPR